MDEENSVCDFICRTPIRSSKQYSYHKLHLYLIKPSKYDDDGYVIRHWKGVLPSNTLACLYALSEDVRSRGVLGRDLKWEVCTIDETVQNIEVRNMIGASRRKGVKTLVCLVGVQSNQFPRAADIALELRAAGMSVLIGGFHVSGVMATLPELTPELQRVKEAGVTLVGGEVEGHWEDLLRDALNDKLCAVYRYLDHPPSISESPIPMIPANLRNKYAVRHMATLDCGRGCPYQCSFCTVINVQGRQMRFRSVGAIVEKIRENYYRHKIRHYFFTDDNFCRNGQWENIFDALIRMREEEGIKITFMMQVDTKSYRVDGFIEKASRAGCSQVFIGIESLNEANLKSAGKNQNQTSHFKELIEAYRKAGISPHLAYIIGFPFDGEDSVREDIGKLQDLGAEQASFFMLTPLPGSMDYVRMKQGSAILDHDLNNYDSFHETFRHENMRGGSWSRVYWEAWTRFYSVENMKRILYRVTAKKYWGVFYNFIWYKNAFQVEGGHPMIHGFIRLKGRRNRRKCFSLESHWNYFKRRLSDFSRLVSGWGRLVLEMEEVWLATRKRSPLEEQVVGELSRLRSRVNEWRNIRLSDLQRLYRQAAEKLEHPTGRCVLSRFSIPSQFRLWLRKWNVFSDSLTFTRRPMTQFWKKVIGQLMRGHVHRISFLGVAFTSFREGVLFLRFIISVLRRSTCAESRS
ncbi:MAG: radical SAM protein [Candidatus Omnitrophica bacterium]|nr:radical SAM protein [Candidatus Omnitrophota bacterium]